MVVFSCIIILIGVYLLYRTFRPSLGKKHKPVFTGVTKAIAVIAGIFILFIGVSALIASQTSKQEISEQVAKKNSSSSSSSSNTSVSSSSEETKKSSSSSSSSHKKNNSKSSKLKAINAEIADTLDEDKGFADGSLDENGNPTENGTPNPEFAGYLTIDNMAYNDSDMLTIQVNSLFLTLSDDDKKTAINQAQNMAVVATGNHKKLNVEEYNDKPYTAVHYGTKSVGRSKITNTADFKWAK